jgi:quinol monooxygenase YgiN
MSHLIIVATIDAHAGQEALVRAELEKIVAPSRAEAGCVRYELHADHAAPGRFVMLEEWRGEEAFRFHEGTPHFQALVAAVGGKADIALRKLAKIA